MTDQLWIEYSDTICNYFKKRTGNRPLSCDLMQDTFKKVLEHQDQLENIENYRAWLYQIARNTLIDYNRKKKEQSLPDAMLVDENHNGEDRASNINDIADCLYQLIQEYDGEKQEILINVFQKSLTQKEASQYLDIPYSTFKSRVQKARAQIIKEFNKRCCHLKYDRNGRIIGCA